jgi:hypothetical protein
MKAILCTLSISALLLFCSIPLFAFVTVSGTIVGSDNPTVGLNDAAIILDGFEVATTNAAGYFNATDIMENITYTYTITHEFYNSATGQIIVGTQNLDMGTIMLTEIVYPPTNAQAFVLDANVQLNWTHSMGPFLGYKVWRLHEGEEQNEASWTLLTPSNVDLDNFVDTNWSTLPEGSYQWAVKAVMSGNVLSAAAFTNVLNNTTGNDDNMPPPLIITALESCSPNPFKTSTAIRYSLSDKAPLLLEIYNFKGQKVKTLFHATQYHGHHYAIWNGTNDQNKPVSAGVYLYKMSSGKFTASRKVILVK